MFRIIPAGGETSCSGHGQQTVRLLFNPGDNLTYAVRLRLVDGKPVLGWEPYPVQMTSADGQPTVADVPEAAPSGTFDVWQDDTGRYRTLTVTERDGVRVIEWR